MTRIRAAALLTLAGVLALVIPAAHPAVAADPGPRFTVKNGTSECWGSGGRSTLWHFIVFNGGDKGGRYKVEYRRGPDDELKTYSEKVPRGQGINDGLVIPAGGSIDYIRVSAAGQGTLFLRYGVDALTRCTRS